jgi:hypothetical protein
MDSQEKQHLLDEIQNELSNNQDNSDPNSIEYNNAVKNKEMMDLAMAVPSNATATRTCGIDEDGNWVCKP